MEGEGFGGKERDWNRKELLSEWRETWAREANEALRRAGIGERIDHRSLIVQRDEALVRGEIWKAEKLDRDPEIHLGGPLGWQHGKASVTSGLDATTGSSEATRTGRGSGAVGGT